MILAFDATNWYAIGAVLAGVGSLLGGIAAIWVAKGKAKNAKKNSAVLHNGK